MAHLHTHFSFKEFAHHHDDLPAFHAGFLVLTFLVAALFNLGVFALMILAHMSLDTVKYRDVHGLKGIKVVEGVVRESLVDITLFCLGLAFAVYLHHSLPVIGGLAGLARAETTILRSLATLLPKMKILHHTLCILSNIQNYLSHIHPRMGKGWSMTDRLCFIFSIASVLLVIAAPALLGIDAAHLERIIFSELIPGAV